MVANKYSKIVEFPIIRSGVDKASRVSVCIELFCQKYGKDTKVGSGSGFFRHYGSDLFLITNWHVLTGRLPEEPNQLLNDYPDSPSSMQIYVARESDPNHFVPLASIPLYDEGKACWIEAKPFNGCRIDLAAIKLGLWKGEPTDKPLITSIEEFKPGSRDILRIGKDVVIVGYPFDIEPRHPYPIWKRGFIASEPSILINGLPKYYVDTPGRPGMSGSPIFMIESGIGLPRETASRLNDPSTGRNALDIIKNIDTEQLRNAPKVNVMKFAGVYSGSMGDQSLEKLRVGVAWHAAMVDRIFTNPVEGSNPHMPFFV